MLHELEVSFTSKKLTYTQVKKTEKGYIYHVHSGGSNVPYFHVFKRKTAKVCIDFEKRIYSDTETKETYPKDECFGVWAWIYFSLDKAIEHLNKF